MEINTSWYHRNQTDQADQADEDHDGNIGFVPVVDTLPVILAFLIIITNGLGIFLFIRNRRLRNITNTFLVSLAISDLLTGLFAIPFYLVCSATQSTLCRVTILFWRFTTTSTVLHLLVVTLDRYAAIVHAIRYHAIITRSRANIAIFTTWTLSLIVSLVQLFWPMASHYEDDHTIVIYLLTTLVVFFVLPLLVMIYSYISIFNVVRYHEKQIKKQNRPSALEKRKDSTLDIPAQWKSALVFLVMTIVYVICWFPYFVYMLRDALFPILIPHWAEYVFFYYPRFITSLTNPIFYIVGKHDFRKALFRSRRQRNSTQMTSLMSHGRSSSFTNSKTRALSES